MKTLKLIPTLLLFLLVSCSAVSVNSDYDKQVDFTQYKTFAFFKTGIDKVEISDIDKKRILISINEEMELKGFTKSETPDLLININTKTDKNISVNQFSANWGYGAGYGWGWGWSPYWGANTSVSTAIEGVLTIDFIDAKKKELVWQGEGTGYLTKNSSEKEAIIKRFVFEILKQYPPNKK